jgi:hypothetical protein
LPTARTRRWPAIKSWDAPYPPEQARALYDYFVEAARRTAVPVQTGEFQAMKVETKIIQGGTPVTKTYWFANWIGMVKSMTDTGSVKSTTELLDYSFKKTR